MTRGALQCVACGRTGHVSANCPEQPRTWWRRLRDVLAMRDPFDVDTVFQESQSETVWPEITGPSKLERRS